MAAGRHVAIGGVRHYAELALAPGCNRLAATVVPTPRLVAGVVVETRGAASPGVPLELQLHVSSDKESAEGRVAWRTIASTVADEHGAFAIAAFAPRGAPLRVRLPGACGVEPIDVQAGVLDLCIEAPVRRTAFGARRR